MKSRPGQGPTEISKKIRHKQNDHASRRTQRSPHTRREQHRPRPSPHSPRAAPPPPSPPAKPPQPAKTPPPKKPASEASAYSRMSSPDTSAISPCNQARSVGRPGAGNAIKYASIGGNSI